MTIDTTAVKQAVQTAYGDALLDGESKLDAAGLARGIAMKEASRCGVRLGANQVCLINSWLREFDALISSKRLKQFKDA
jgi:hypothetical protein